MDRPRYATRDGRHLAYRQLPGADGPNVVLITPGGTIPMDYLGRDRIGARLIEGLTAIGPLVLFDRRGIGLSDPIDDWTRPLPEQWAEDLEIIVSAACTTPPVVVSLGDYWGPARSFAGTHPTALSHLVLYEPHGPVIVVDLGGGLTEREDEPPSEPDWITRVCPSRADDAAFREWFDMAGRTGASPSIAPRLYATPPDAWSQRLDADHHRIEVPTLVLRRPGNRLGSPEPPDPVATAIPDGRRVDLSGEDYHWLGEEVDELLTEVTRFVTGQTRLPAPTRSLRAVLFTDLVGSTERAASAGDARWTSMLDRHDQAIAEEVLRRGGIVVKSTGDGVLATLPSGDGAVRAAHAITGRLAQQGLEVRVGIHVGDVEQRGDDVSGLAVHIAARVMALAGAGEVLVTSSVIESVVGTPHRFEPAGDHELKGCPGTWSLHQSCETNEETDR